MDVTHEINLLVQELTRFGGSVKFGTLCRDERCSDIFEALVGTLKAAKKRKIVAYDSELLLQGPHDDVEIRLVQQPAAVPEASTDAAETPAASTEDSAPPQAHDSS
mmetsp:Transcript_20606/g.62050  ORF Transcript_20606/g.62050 Transcript_20606/m.62050 type:complete len:106 (-) Transcript_20606:1921-2238(-)